jgi:hypothetical protein
LRFLWCRFTSMTTRGFGTFVASAGVPYPAPLAFTEEPAISVAVLLVGRAVLEAAESFIITGGVSWGMRLVDSAHAGEVIAWVDTGMFLVLALGAPISTMLFSDQALLQWPGSRHSFHSSFLSCFRARPQSRRGRNGKASSLGNVARQVWLPGIRAALSSIGYCAMLGGSRSGQCAQPTGSSEARAVDWPICPAGADAEMGLLGTGLLPKGEPTRVTSRTKSAFRIRIGRAAVGADIGQRCC